MTLSGTKKTVRNAKATLQGSIAGFWMDRETIRNLGLGAGNVIAKGAKNTLTFDYTLPRYAWRGLSVTTGVRVTGTRGKRRGRDVVLGCAAFKLSIV